MELVIFIMVQTITVIVSTIKSIVTVKGSRLSASIINAIAYTLGMLVVKLVTKQSFETVIVSTFFINLIGVYFAKWIMDKRQPERLWIVDARVESEEMLNKITEKLFKRSIRFSYSIANEMTTIDEEDTSKRIYIISILCYSKGESKLTEEILEKYKCKYFINVSKDSF